jgi:hypothetical protein
MPTVIQIKRGTASSWTSANAILANGEIGFETDTRKMKVGDGSTAWTSLAYTATDGDITAVVAGTGLSGGSTSGSATLSIDSTVATLTGTQTLTNKTLTSPVLTTPSISTMTTTGDILYASSANTPARLGIGSTGQILAVSGGVPSWTAAPSSGGMTLISTATPSASSLIQFTSIPNTYKDLVIVGHLTPSADGNGSSAWTVNGDTGNHYISTIFSASDSTTLTGSSAWQGHNNMTNTKPMSIHWTMFDYANTTTQIKQSDIFLAGFHYTTTTNVSNQYGHRFFYYKGSTSAISSIRLDAVVGTYTGTLQLYGIS